MKRRGVFGQPRIDQLPVHAASTVVPENHTEQLGRKTVRVGGRRGIGDLNDVLLGRCVLLNALKPLVRRGAGRCAPGRCDDFSRSCLETADSCPSPTYKCVDI